MIIKPLKAQSFAGVLNYILREGSIKLFSNGVRETAKEMNDDMELYRSSKPDIKYPCLHLIVSFHADDNDKLNQEKLAEIGKEILTRFGVTDKFQYVAVQHTDGKSPHLHICLNRICEEGNVLKDSFSVRRLNKIRLELENEYPELTVAKSKNLNQTNLEKLRGTDKIKYEIYIAIKKEIASCKSIDDLIFKLDTNHNIKTALKYKRESIEVQGIKFNKDNVWLKGSEVDKQCSYYKLMMHIENINSQTKKIEEFPLEYELHEPIYHTQTISKTPLQMFQTMKDLLIKEGNPEDNIVLNKGLDFVRNKKKRRGRRM